MKLCKNLEIKYMMKQEMSEMECLRDTYSIILKLIAEHTAGQTQDSKVEKLDAALSYMHLHMTKHLSNDFLASMCDMSTVYFRKMFKEVYGTSPMDYLKRLRIEKAKELLRGDHGSVTDIALSLGYANIYDFSRDFKKHVGISPSEFK